MVAKKRARAARTERLAAFKERHAGRRPPPEKIEAIALDVLRQIDRLEAAVGAEAEMARTRSEVSEWDALDVAREAIRAVWGPRGEEEATERRMVQRWAMVGAAHQARAGVRVIQAIGIVRNFAAMLLDRPGDEAYVVDRLLRLLALDFVDAGDLNRLRGSPERVDEIATWLRHCKDGTAKSGANWTSPPHAILARIVEASHGRPTDPPSIKPVVIEYAKAIEKHRTSTGF